MNDTTDDGRVEVTLAKQLVNRGRMLEPGDKVRLLPMQIEALVDEGYFDPDSVRAFRGGGRRPRKEAK